MKLTENQKIVMRAILTKTPTADVVMCWDEKHDRHLALDEIVEILKKLKITIRKEDVKYLRRIADMGK